jgi:hypothetical protein
MKTIGILTIVLALVTGIVPAFTDCQSQGKMLTLENGREIPMKCHWTGLAEIALAAPLLATGVVMTVSRRKETFRSTGVLGAILGMGVILLPTRLIGVCGNPDMICNSIMKPTLTMTGSVAIALGVIAVALPSLRQNDVALTDLSE